MNAKELKQRLEHRPFEPFRLVTSDGETHLIRHPELAHLAGGRVLYVFEPVDSEEANVTFPKMISLTHVTTMEPTEQQS